MNLSLDTAALYLAAVAIGAFLLWELTSEWRARRSAHRQRMLRDAEADREPRV